MQIHISTVSLSMFWVTFEKTISTVELKKKKRKKAKERKKSECNNIFLNNYLIEKKPLQIWWEMNSGFVTLGKCFVV